MKRIALIATLILVSATPVFAHSGHGITSGFLHPFLGWDHLIAMLAVGALGRYARCPCHLGRACGFR